MKFKICAAALVFCASSAFAGPIVNGNFGGGSLAGWDISGPVTLQEDVDGYYATLIAGQGAGIYTAMKQTLNLRKGDILTGKALFNGRDYMPYNDDAFVTIGGVSLFQSNIATVGSYGSSGLVSFKWTALTTGNYILSMGVANHGDNAASSELLVRDFAVSSEVPEPASLALMGLGLFGVGAMRRMAAKNKNA